MMRLGSIAALGCFLPLIEAGGFKWNSNNAHDLGSHTPAQETGAVQMQMQPVSHPEPTSPPELKRSKIPLDRRDSSVPGSVCGYMSHDLESPLACASDNTCLFTTFGNSWVAGCCSSASLASCEFATTCIDSSVGESLLSIGDSTYWCSSSDYPVCVTLSFQDVPGYTIYNCGGSEVVTYQSIDHSLDPSDTTTSSEEVTSASNSRVATSAASASASGAKSSETSSASPTAAAAAGSSKSSTPIGAIVGGAVGGVAVIALLILGIIFIIRKTGRNNNNNNNNNNSNNPPDPAAYANQPPPPHAGPQMQQGPPMHQAPPIHQGPPPPFTAVRDNRMSIQKAPYDVNTNSVYAPTVSTPGSPPPPPQSPSPGPGPVLAHGYPPSSSSPPPQPSPSQQGHGISPGEGTYAVSQQSGGGAPAHQSHHSGSYTFHEMSSTRPDGELRELP